MDEPHPRQYHRVNVQHRHAGLVHYVETKWIPGAEPEPRIVHAELLGQFSSKRLDVAPSPDEFELADTIDADDSLHGGCPVRYMYWKRRSIKLP